MLRRIAWRVSVQMKHLLSLADFIQNEITTSTIKSVYDFRNAAVLTALIPTGQK